MLLRPLLLRALLPLFIPLSALAGTTWYVDASGTPPGSGTRADPYTSIQHAIGQPGTLEGDTLLVAPGTYVENVDYAEKALHLVATDGPLATVIQAAGPGPAVLANADAAPASASLEGFTVTGAQGSAPGIHVLESASAFLTVRRCIVRDNAGPGILVEYDGWVFETTMVGNERGFVSQSLGLLLMRHCISWGNALPPAVNQVFGNLVELSDLETVDLGAIACKGCFSEDPRFWDLAGRDLKLRADSPCIEPEGSLIDLGALAFDPFHALGTATSCDGSAALCPCGNGGAPGAGCEIAQGTGGVAIAIRDFLPDGAGGGTAVILGTGYPPATAPGVTLIRSPAPETPPVVFGDGLRCIATAGLVRVRATLAAGGTAQLSISQGAGAGTFYYQLWNRNAPASYCTPAAFNLSNALEIAWP